MEQRRIPVSQQALDQLSHYDLSIQHWSQEHTKASLQIKAMIDNIESLYQARQGLLDKACAEAGVDPTQVVQMRPVKNGETVELALLIKPPQAPPGAPDAVPTAPPAPAG